MNKSEISTQGQLRDAAEAAQSTTDRELEYVTLDGKKIAVRHDFTRRLKLDQSPLLLVDKRGIDIREAHKNVWRYAWFDDDDLRRKLMEGYSIVTDPDVRAPAQNEADREREGKIVVRELTACRIPYAEWLAYEDHLERERIELEEAVEAQTQDALVEEGTGRLRGRTTTAFPDGGITSKQVKK